MTALLEDGAIWKYIEFFYRADDDHQRVIYASYIIGYLAAILDVSDVCVCAKGEEK